MVTGKSSEFITNRPAEPFKVRQFFVRTDRTQHDSAEPIRPNRSADPYKKLKLWLCSLGQLLFR